MAIARSAWLADTHDQEPESFEALFNRHYGVIYATLFRLTGDRAEAEDLTQETFLRLYDVLRPPQKLDNVGGWLYRVATRLGFNSLRAAHRRASHEQAAAEPEEARSLDPSEEAAHAERRRQVREALAELSPQQVQVLILRHSGLSYKELADVLGVAPTSVGTLLARAERAFEARYRAQTGTEAGPPLF